MSEHLGWDISEVRNRRIAELEARVKELEIEVHGYAHVSDHVRQLTGDYESADIDFTVGRLLRERQTAQQELAQEREKREQAERERDELQRWAHQIHDALDGRRLPEAPDEGPARVEALKAEVTRLQAALGDLQIEYHDAVFHENDYPTCPDRFCRAARDALNQRSVDGTLKP